MPKWFACVALAVAATVLGACSGGESADGSATTTPTAKATTTAAPSTTLAPTTTTIGRRGSGEPVTFAFGGDTHFEGELESQLASNPSGMLSPIAPLLSAADLAVVNLETAITERGEPAPKEFTFRAPPSALTAVAWAGVDVVTMANNHGMDYGEVGLEDSLTATRLSGFPIVGIGNNAGEAYAPYRTTIKGQRIAVFGATQVLDDNLITAWTATDEQPGLASAKEVERLTASVATARADSDTIVVFLHWGVETQTCPTTTQQDLARQLVDAGADIVVGGHAHRLQGAGRMDNALIAYGLGNFVFYAKPGDGAKSGVLTVTATGRDIDSYQWHPATIRNGVPRPLEGDAEAAAVAEWDGLRGCTGLAP